MAIGVSFVPSTPEQSGAASGAGRAVSPLQQAIQFLSLRLPKVFGPGAIAPAATMTAAGGSGIPADAGGIDAFLRTLIQQAGQTGRPGESAPPAQNVPTAPTMAAALPSNYAPPAAASAGAFPSEQPTAPMIPPLGPPPAPPPSIPSPRIRPGDPTSGGGVVSSPYQRVAPMMSNVLARQPGSADALIQMIQQTQLPGGAAPAPQPTAPQRPPAGPPAQGPGQFPFNVSDMFGRGRGI